jgi:glycosyltransferase involved in cell wall biosynthesis
LFYGAKADNIQSLISYMSSTPNSKISIILPCHNEEEAILPCLKEIEGVIVSNDLNAEIVVVDNASTDRSPSLLMESLTKFPDLRVVKESRLGYGFACLKGIESAEGEYVVIADCDGTYDFKLIIQFISKLLEGNDLVVGNRFNGEIMEGAMPWLHRHIGNPLLSLLVKIFFGVKIGDIHSGMRAFKKSVIESINLNTGGMEFASEMVVKAAKRNLYISEIPISYRKRLGKSKLRSFSDGWRHLRFILLYSPLVLFFIPGALLLFLGTISLLILYFGSPSLFGIQFYVHPIFLSSVAVIAGYQLVLFAAFARTYAITHLGDHDGFFEPLYRLITIERAGLVGILLSFFGGSIYAYIFIKWINSGFGSLDEIKNGVVALTLVVVGIQTFFSAFMLSILGIKEK